ncbi:hypothetical protein LTR37_020238 [Vermiconidia calcicola]|uniref:Uncharacterized protein n=1 Tax=Vermiconidia calcicola TaxID=1690605 RepID=A0ACC3MD62_9PEZI|nr:hypothetical protein LTR37_020238 [Vermiconidia calcicola]
MASAASPHRTINGESSYMTQPDTSAAEAALKAKLSRKRTKTGCLTCRKRRIKCGEERPVCKNCVKSKRHCEGYNQRVIFKPPNYEYRHVVNGTAHIAFQAAPVSIAATPHAAEYGQDSAYYSYLPPTPNEQYVPGYSDLQQQQRHVQFDQQAMPYPGPPQLHPVQLPPGYVFQSGQSQQQAVQPTALPYHVSHTEHSNVPHPPVGAFDFSFQPLRGSVSSADQLHPPADWQRPYASKHDQKWNTVSHTTNDAYDNKISPASSHSSRTMGWSQSSAPDHSSPSWSSRGYGPRPELSRPIDYQPPTVSDHQHLPNQVYPSIAPVVQPQNQTTPEFYEHEEHGKFTTSTTEFLTQAAVETQDDDYYDVDSAEEIGMQSTALTPVYQERQRALQNILQANDINVEDPQTRRYDTFTYGGALADYKPEEAANPLRNSSTARVFAHFIAVTGPSMSIYERQLLNTSVLFTEGQVPLSQQGLWTYTMPMAALHHQGLLHAMLAVASLHIARLSNASVTPSYQHYAWALKRVHSDVGDEKKRLRLTTIAASMLLGWYEVMTADHVKWNMHLAGTKQLFLETDFSTMSKQLRRMKNERAARRGQGKKRKASSARTQAQDEVLDQIHDVDERIISELSGREVRYDSHGQITTSANTVPPPLDLGKFEILKDLYWWYLKQDVYQSIISGNPLMLDHSRWANCPPRAPLGKADAVYGSFDHLVLLLGRIAEFSARDRVRKLKVMEANGGQWRPAPGMKLPGPPQQAPPTPQPPGQNSQAAPQFYGMAPPPRQNVQMPSSYSSTRNRLTPDAPSPGNPVDLHVATQSALEEYGRIRAALHTFVNSLGEGFKPLTSDYQPPLETPFGPALFYRSYTIGCLWATYHMAMIIAIRSHPHMPPAAHAAAAIAAHETQFFANQIGRITAGIVSAPPGVPLNPTLGAALCESCMASFFAAIQYQNADQRHHAVTRMYAIAKRTGWASLELMAMGCETSWIKGAAAGRGPPYTRVVRREESDDPRVNGSWEELDPNAGPDEKDDGDRRLVATKPNARLNWAIGAMGTEDDERMRATN